MTIESSHKGPGVSSRGFVLRIDVSYTARRTESARLSSPKISTRWNRSLLHGRRRPKRGVSTCGIGGRQRPMAEQVFATIEAAEEALVQAGRAAHLRLTIRPANTPADCGYSRAMGFPVGQLRDYRRRASDGLDFHLQEYPWHFELHLDRSATRRPLQHAWDVFGSWRLILELRARGKRE